MLSKLVRNAALATLFTIPAISLLGVRSALADRRDVVIHNNTDLVMTKLYVSLPRSSSWGRNRLPSQLLSGEKYELKFNNDSTECVYDVKAVYEDGSYDQSTDNLCEKSTLYYYGYGGEQNRPSER